MPRLRQLRIWDERSMGSEIEANLGSGAWGIGSMVVAAVREWSVAVGTPSTPQPSLMPSMVRRRRRQRANDERRVEQSFFHRLDGLAGLDRVPTHERRILDGWAC